MAFILRVRYNGRHGGRGMREVEANVNDESGPCGFYNLSAVLWSSCEIGSPCALESRTEAFQLIECVAQSLTFSRCLLLFPCGS